MRWFSILRVIVLLRRIDKSMERICAAVESLAADSRNRYERETARPRPRPTEFDTLDVAEVEKHWRKQRDAESVGEDFPQ